MTSADFQMVLSAVSVMLREQPTHIAKHGVAMGGTWAPNDVLMPNETTWAGTAQVMIGSTAAIIMDPTGGAIVDANGAAVADGDTWIPLPNVSFLTPALGFQYGVRGNERVVIFSTENGPYAMLAHGDDDSPGAPAGETWICHRNAAGVVDSYIKLTNDGDNNGDGLGGLQLGFGSLAVIETAGGHTIRLDENGQQISATSAGGISVVWDDNTGTFQIQGSGTASGYAVVRLQDLQTALNAMTAAVQAAFNSLSGSVQGGSGVTPPTVAATTATGSAKTFTA